VEVVVAGSLVADEAKYLVGARDAEIVVGGKQVVADPK